MNSYEILSQIITDNGREICKNKSQCKAIIYDSFPVSEIRSKNLLLAVIEDGYVSDMIDNPGKINENFQRYINNLNDHRGIHKIYAMWAVYSWMYALGLTDNTILSRIEKEINSPLNDINSITFHDYNNIKVDSEISQSEEFKSAVELTERYTWQLKYFGIDSTPLPPIIGPRFIELQIRCVTILSDYCINTIFFGLPGGDISLIQQNNDILKIQYPREEWTSIDVLDCFSTSKFPINNKFELKIPLGMCVDGSPFIIDLNDKNFGGGIILSGRTGSGKTVTLGSIIVSLTLSSIPGAVLFTPIFWQNNKVFRTESPIFRNQTDFDTSNPIAVLGALKIITNDIEKRRKIIEKSGSENINEYNNKGPNFLPYHIVLIDGYDLIFEHRENIFKEIRKWRNAYECGYRFIFSICGYISIDEEIDYNFNISDLHDTIDYANVSVIISQSSSYDEIRKIIKYPFYGGISSKGDMIISGRNPIIRVQSPMVSERDFDMFQNHIKLAY